MQNSFQVGSKYTRRDIYQLIGIPEDTHGGNWDTGYARHENNWFIFCNIGATGRTGHDYANRWVGDRLEWYGKNSSQVCHPSIQSILSEDNHTYIFWRENNKQPFTFAGVGSAEKVEDVIPVKITWTFETAMFPDEVFLTDLYLEGSSYRVSVNIYERSPIARQKCIEHYGISCFICGFNFREVYGELGEGFIHVHHLLPLSEIGKEYEIKPIEDLRPVCPNCHAMIHRKSPPLSIKEIQGLLAER
jgi:5-methylcytosine-specific restriction enzyme A